MDLKGVIYIKVNGKVVYERKELEEQEIEPEKEIATETRGLSNPRSVRR